MDEGKQDYKDQQKSIKNCTKRVAKLAPFIPNSGIPKLPKIRTISSKTFINYLICNDY